MKIGYIIPLYFGPRNHIHPKYNDDIFFLIKTQFEYIEKLKNKFDKIYIICTFHDWGSSDNIINKLKLLLKDYNNVVIEKRENLGGSYCSWKHALNMDNGECDYIFLNEDDHVLFEPNIIGELLQYWDETPELFYLCQYWTDKPYSIFHNGINYSFPNHATMSAGMINNKLYHKLRIENNLDFNVIYDGGYNVMYLNQSMFLEDYRLNNVLIKDWRDKYSSYFPHSDMDFGNENGLKLLMPIIEKFF